MPAERSVPSRTTRTIWLISAAALTLALAGCGGDSGTAAVDEAVEAARADAEEAVESARAEAEQAVESAATAGAETVEDLEAQAQETAEELAENLTESLEQAQAAAGGGSATLTVGDQTWTFDSVLCAFGEEQIGAEGAEFVLSSIQDGLQLYASIDSFGHSVSLNDVEDFQNPSVALVADRFAASMAGTSEEFVMLDGTSVAATAPFLDNTTDSTDPIEGILEADCP